MGCGASAQAPPSTDEAPVTAAAAEDEALLGLAAPAVDVAAMAAVDKKAEVGEMKKKKEKETAKKLPVCKQLPGGWEAPRWTPASLPKSGMVSASHQAIENALIGWLVEKRIPGATLAIVDKNGAPLTRRAFGVCDLETMAPLLPEHGVGYASIGKTIHTAGLVALVEDGHMNLEETLASFFDGVGDCDASTTTIGKKRCTSLLHVMLLHAMTVLP